MKSEICIEDWSRMKFTGGTLAVRVKIRRYFGYGSIPDVLGRTLVFTAQDQEKRLVGLPALRKFADRNRIDLRREMARRPVRFADLASTLEDLGRVICRRPRQPTRNSSMELLGIDLFENRPRFDGDCLKFCVVKFGLFESVPLPISEVVLSLTTLTYETQVVAEYDPSKKPRKSRR